MKAHDLRTRFIEFFVERQHRLVASSPLVPPDDPTLLFTTAGMVQFKRLYSGAVPLPYTRACSVQKCLRAGGKGSDLENVGRTLRHHTFFEMLGNFSFGDYFKREALAWAWEFSTKIANLDPARLYASVYEDDDEAWDIWVKEIGMPESHMVRLGAKDNFWGPAGETGACGPCSEIYFDRGEQYGPGLSFQHATLRDDDPNTRYIEFWNCVFPQFDQQKDGSRPPLKNRGVDTGMGLERLACITQGAASPFETDLLRPIVDRVCELTGVGRYDALPIETRQCVNVAADHVRALVFALSEGILPSNDGRGYVLRRLLRRAARYARRIGQETPFLFQAVDTVLDVMGDAYPEIKESPDLIRRVIRQEEEAYDQTLGAGLQRLEALFEKTAGQSLAGSDVFNLVATYGMPFDDICEIAADRGWSIDREGYAAHVARHKEESRKGAKGSRFEGIAERLKEIFQEFGKTDFVGYAEFDDGDEELASDDYTDHIPLPPGAEAKVRDLRLGRFDHDEDDDEFDEEDVSPEAWEETFDDEAIQAALEDLFEYPVLTAQGIQIYAMFRGDEEISIAHKGDEVALVLSHTPFYAEAGGQVADTGVVITDSARVRITDVQKTPEEIFVHFGVVEEGILRQSDLARAEIDAERRWAIMRNHTATHLLQGALKRVVGKHVTQQGSYVGPDYLRFDFTNPEALTAAQLAEVERLVNEQIMKNHVLEVTVTTLEKARSIPGIIAPFGEKYGSTVRVVDVPDWDVEFCGGTHMPATGGIGTFVILSESAISAGVRRIEATTGAAAVAVIQRERGILRSLGEQLSVPAERVPERLAAVLEELRNARKQIQQLRAKSSAAEAAELLTSAPEHGGVRVVTKQFDGMEAAELRAVYDGLKSRQPAGLVAVLASVADGRVTVIAGVTEDVTKRGVSAGEIVKQIAPIIGGSGGGKKEMAQAGGRNAAGVAEALAKAARMVAEMLAVNA
ncbi:MAG: alanine--tRNA ligase [Candidatus Sumerlaeaceae bacterium]|nr:alanine--tRNA ligase [Candidatus Sumerlaeaceae bacterium]